MDWYDNIEPGVRDVVKYLRDNGINTECSCEHEMSIQCQFVVDGTIQIIHNLLYNYYEGKYGTCSKVNFEITAKHKVVDGHSYTNLMIYIPDKKND